MHVLKKAGHLISESQVTGGPTNTLTMLKRLWAYYKTKSSHWGWRNASFSLTSFHILAVLFALGALKCQPARLTPNTGFNTASTMRNSSGFMVCATSSLWSCFVKQQRHTFLYAVDGLVWCWREFSISSRFSNATCRLNFQNMTTIAHWNVPGALFNRKDRRVSW